MFSPEKHSYFSSNTYTKDTFSRNLFGLGVKSFDDSTKNRYFSRLYNDWKNMFININKEKLFSYFLSNISETCQDGLKTTLPWNQVFISFISKHFFHKLEIFETSYLSIINCIQLFPTFSIFLFLLILSLSLFHCELR